MNGLDPPPTCNNESCSRFILTEEALKNSIAANFVRKVLDRTPYVGRLRKLANAAGGYPPGHYYSPIPTPEEAAACFTWRNTATPEIRLDPDRQFERLQTFETFYRDVPFPEKENGRTRYHFDQSYFCYADAIFLYSFLRHVQPKRIIEVGSGFSSAVILDTTERFFSNPPEMTFIEPYAGRLRQLLRPQDAARVTVIEKTVQSVPIETFDRLGPGDLLFIDSSHVVKCGSDVYFLMFEALPRLQPGVFVHFHDIFDSFEYLDNWLLKEGWYWNEAYFLRAFLAYNSAWEVYFFNSYVARVFEAFIAEKMPLCLKNAGGSLYIRRLPV